MYSDCLVAFTNYSSHPCRVVCWIGKRNGSKSVCLQLEMKTDETKSLLDVSTESSRRLSPHESTTITMKSVRDWDGPD